MKIEIDIKLSEIYKPLIRAAVRRDGRACLVGRVDAQDLTDQLQPLASVNRLESRIEIYEGGTIDVIRYRKDWVDLIRGRDYDYVLLRIPNIDLGIVRWAVAPTLIDRRGKCEYTLEGGEEVRNLFS